VGKDHLADDVVVVFPLDPGVAPRRRRLRQRAQEENGRKHAAADLDSSHHASFEVKRYKT
jgi:hypothetical protein